jgi:hypothetical protein
VGPKGQGSQWGKDLAVPCGARAGIPVGPGSGGPMQSWVLAGPERWGAQQNGAVAPWAYGAGTWQARCYFI